MAAWVSTPPSPPITTAKPPSPGVTQAAAPMVAVVAAPVDDLHIVPEFHAATFDAITSLTAVSKAGLRAILASEGLLGAAIHSTVNLSSVNGAVGALSGTVRIPLPGPFFSSGDLSVDSHVALRAETEGSGDLSAELEARSLTDSLGVGEGILSGGLYGVAVTGAAAGEGELSALVAASGGMTSASLDGEGELTAYTLVMYVRAAALDALGDVTADALPDPSTSGDTATGSLTVGAIPVASATPSVTGTGTLTASMDGFTLDWVNQGGKKLGDQDLGRSSTTLEAIQGWTDFSGYSRDLLESNGMGYNVPPGTYLASIGIDMASRRATYGVGVIDVTAGTSTTFASITKSSSSEVAGFSGCGVFSTAGGVIRAGARCDYVTSGYRTVRADTSYFILERHNPAQAGPKRGVSVTGGDKTSVSGSWSKVISTWGALSGYPTPTVSADGVVTYPGGQVEINATITNSGSSSYSPTGVRIMLDGYCIGIAPIASYNVNAKWMGTVPAGSQVWMETYTWSGFSDSYHTVTLTFDPITV